MFFNYCSICIFSIFNTLVFYIFYIKLTAKFPLSLVPTRNEKQRELSCQSNVFFKLKMLCNRAAFALNLSIIDNVSFSNQANKV